MKHFTFKSNVSRIAILCLLFISIYSCNQKKPAKQKPWHHKDVMPPKLKWFLNSTNYSDSNYKERFQGYYSNYLAEGHPDSALFCLLVYGKMTDQNYLYDTLYLNAAIQHLKRFEPISVENGELIKLYYYIGSQYEANGDYSLAEEWYQNGIKNPKILDDTKIKCLGMLAQVYHNTNQAENALPLQLESLRYYEKKNDTINIGVTYANMATTYQFLSAYETSLQYNTKAIDYAREMHDTNTLIPFITNYFVILKNSDENFNYSAKNRAGLQELNKICNAYSKLSPYNEWVTLILNSHYYWQTNKLDSLKLSIDKMSEIVKLLNSPSFDNELAYIQARFDEKIGAPIKNEKKLIELADYYDNNEMWWEAFHTNIILYTYAKSKGDFKNALKYYEKKFDLEIRRMKEKSTGQVYEMDIKYQTEKKNQEILIQAEQLKIKQRNIVLLLASLVIIALSFLAYFLWQKKKTISEKRKSESQFTQKLMENTEDERMRIAKDLHDSVGHELLSMKNALSNKLQFTEEKIDHILAEVREISRNLFPVMFEEIGLKISVEQLAESIFNTDNLYVSHEVNYIAGTLDVKSELQVYRIIQEALNNTRKYAQAKSAKISIQQSKNFINVEIKDNGKGFDVMEVLKSGKSFGLLAINQRSKALKASVATESNSKGTTISLEIPINNV